MRSIRFPLGATAALVLVSACGGDGGTPPDENQPPVAGFTEVCTALSCVFTNTSTDDGTFTSSWTFGDSPTPVAGNNQTHVYLTPGVKTVTLTVTDNDGATDDISKDVTVTAPPGPANVLPTASFDLPTGCTEGTPCGFRSTSIDTDGTIETWQWDFGDASELGAGENTTHTYEAAGTYGVVLTVTDNAGGQGTITQQLTVSPPASQDCTTNGTLVDCSLGLTQQVTVKITIVSEDCQLSGNKLTTTPAGQGEQTAFFNLCNQTVGAEYIVKAGDGVTPLVFQPGSTLPLRFHQGPQGTNPPISDPGIQVTGTYPSWTLNIDDGGAAGTAGEPDFNDVVLRVDATVSP